MRHEIRMWSGPLGHMHVYALQSGLQMSLDMTVTLCNIFFKFIREFRSAVTQCPVLGQRMLEKGFVIG